MSSDLAPSEELVSVKEAAAFLRVSESTVWRWINDRRVPSYRLGPKRIYLRRDELSTVLRPARSGLAGLTETDRERLNAVPMSTPQPGVDPVALARALHERQRRKPGWNTGREAWEDINEARDERSRDLD